MYGEIVFFVVFVIGEEDEFVFVDVFDEYDLG